MTGSAEVLSNFSNYFCRECPQAKCPKQKPRKYLEATKRRFAEMNCRKFPACRSGVGTRITVVHRERERNLCISRLILRSLKSCIASTLFAVGRSSMRLSVF